LLYRKALSVIGVEACNADLNKFEKEQSLKAETTERAAKS